MKTIFIGVTVLLAGCTTTSEVIPAGKDSYMISVDSGSRSQGQTRIAAAKTANAFCSKQGKFMVMRRTDSNGNATRYVMEHHGMLRWCPGPESNRHGVSPKGFSYSLQLSLLHAKCAHLESGLYLCPVARERELGRGRQVSTLSAPLTGSA
jgi:hypothetical protein